MWTLIEKSTETKTNQIVSLWNNKPSIASLTDTLNISLEKAELLLKGVKVKTDCGFYTLNQNA